MNLNTPSVSAIFYDAYLRQDRSFEGIFFLAVKTTGIFCRPGCKARAPKKENVEFFASPAAAISKGYRPCKKCQPLQLKGQIPEWVQQALDLIEQYPDQRISDSILQQYQIDPVRLRRWFKTHYQITFQGYQRSHKIAAASQQIDAGGRIIDSALDAGYQSLSGFNQSFKQLTGTSPSRAKDRQLVTVAQILTPLGPMFGAATDEGLCLLEFTDRKALQKQIDRVQRHLKAIFIPGKHRWLDRLQAQLDEYFAGQRREFDLPLRFTGSEFQVKAWQALNKIPYAETRSYQQQAQAIGSATAVRAIASANAANAFAILIPCHRVISKSGTMAGYAGGIWRKQYLLDLERGNLPA